MKWLPASPKGRPDKQDFYGRQRPGPTHNDGVNGLIQRAGCVAGFALLAAGCGSDGQELIASGRLQDENGAPMANTELAAYVVNFEIAGGHRVERVYSNQGIAITTDAQGRFYVQDNDLALSYDWTEEVYECGFVCVDSVIDCFDVEQEVCDTQCETVSYEDCWDECSECCEETTVCTTYEDDEGNTYEECTTEESCEDCGCETQCETVTEDSCSENCWSEIVEQCNETCVLYEEQCDWVTYSHTAYPALSEVVSVQASVVLQQADGTRLTIEGNASESRQAEECERVNGEQRCTLLNRWLQSDDFERAE